jgi:hypothetical protein
MKKVAKEFGSRGRCKNLAVYDNRESNTVAMMHGL